MDRDFSKYPVAVRRILQNEDSLIGFFVAWALAFSIFPLGAFYLGTIVSPASNANGQNHYYDLRIADMHFGGYFALGGLALGVIFALWMTFGYPAQKEREAALENAHLHHDHAELTHHEEISTDFGQRAEHESHE